MNKTDTETDVHEETHVKKRRMRHIACVPCNKTLCGRSLTNGGGSLTEYRFSSIDERCVVCDDIWHSINYCVKCGRSGGEMWGDR